MEHLHLPREMACGSSARRRSGALLIVAVASLLNACGGGPSAGATSTPAGSTAPDTATLTWDAVTDPNLQGYRVYFRTAQETYQPLGQGQPVGNGTTSYQLTSLSSKTTYYMVVTAYDFQGNESAYSNEVSKTTP